MASADERDLSGLAASMSVLTRPAKSIKPDGKSYPGV